MPFQLSGGQKQRIALARAIAINPTVMLLDEPLSNLDPKLREEMRFEIKDLQRKFGFTIIYVTHDQSEAMALSDRILVMSDGMVQQIDTPLNIYQNPANQFVFGFIGLSNFLPVEIEDGAIWIEGVKSAGPVNAALPLQPGNRRLMLATRPSEIDFVHEGEVRGIVKRLTYLGDIIDYRVLIGEVEVRVQKNRKRQIFRQGEPCQLSFNKVLWYARKS